MDTDTIIRLRNLTTGYMRHGKAHAVSRDVTAGLRRGSLTCLLGRNGSGKSTLLRTLCGFQPPLGGEILVAGQVLGSLGRGQLAQTVGIVLTERQEYAASLTVREVVELGRTPYTGLLGSLSAADRSIAAQAIDMVGLGPLASRRLSTLSDGERQKAIIAKTLAQQTPVILLDEPTAYLDFPSKIEAFRLLLNLAHSQGKAVVVSTHDMALALQTADDLWVFCPDGTMATGKPLAMARKGLLNQFFSGSGVSFDADTLTYTFNVDQEQAR